MTGSAVIAMTRGLDRAAPGTHKHPVGGISTASDRPGL